MRRTTGRVHAGDRGMNFVANATPPGCRAELPVRLWHAVGGPKAAHAAQTTGLDLIGMIAHARVEEVAGVGRYGLDDAAAAR